MSFFTSFLKPKEPPKTVFVEETIFNRLGEPYIRVVQQTLPIKELNKMAIVKQYEVPSPFKNVKQRYTNNRAKVTYPVVYVTPERAAEIKTQRNAMRKENEAYRIIANQEEANIEARRKALLSPPSLGRQLNEFKPPVTTAGGKRKTRRLNYKKRKTRRH